MGLPLIPIFYRSSQSLKIFELFVSFWKLVHIYIYKTLRKIGLDYSDLFRIFVYIN